MKEGDTGKFAVDIWWVGEEQALGDSAGWRNEQEILRLKQRVGNKRVGDIDPDIKAGEEYAIKKYEPAEENASIGYVHIEMLEEPNAQYSREPTKWWMSLHDFNRFTDVSSSGRARRALRGLR